MKRIFIFSVILLLLASCTNEVEIGTVVAIVNDNVLTLEQLTESYTEDIWNNFSLEEQREIISQWVDLTLLFDYAQKQEFIAKDIALDFMANNAKNKIYANALIALELQNLKFSNDELYNYYRLREAEFTEQVREFRVQRIYFTDHDELTRVKTMLDNREIAFTPAAHRYSQENIGRNGGHMENVVTKNGPDSLLWEALDKMERFHEVILPINDGWIIARWTDFRVATSNISFYTVREDIEQIIRDERRNDLYEQVLWEARTASNVIILH